MKTISFLCLSLLLVVCAAKSRAFTGDDTMEKASALVARAQSIHPSASVVTVQYGAPSNTPDPRNCRALVAYCSLTEAYLRCPTCYEEHLRLSRERHLWCDLTPSIAARRYACASNRRYQNCLDPRNTEEDDAACQNYLPEGPRR